MNLLLSGVWTGQNPSGYWMSEKYDGVRAYWDGARLWSRNGNEFHPPAAWLATLPAGESLDGELWLGHGCYLATLAAIKRPSEGELWAQMQFRVFDAPAHGGTFENRQAHLATLALPWHVSVVTQEVCTGRAHLKKSLRTVFAHGGEGLMLREPESRYIGERSNTLLKVRCANNSELLHD